MKIITILMLMCGVFLFGQKEPDLEGEYYFKNNSATIFIFNKTKFLAVGYVTAILGNIEVIDNAIYFKPDHPNSEILLYGRRNIKKKQIIFNQYFFRNKLYFGALSDQKNKEPLNFLYKDNDYCVSQKYVIPFKINPQKVFIKISSDDSLFTSFSIHNDYDEFLPVYLEKDSDISFLNGVITIKNSQIMLDETVKRKSLNITNEIKEIIKDLEKIDSLLENDFIYLDSDYNIISTEEVDLNNYSYDTLKNEYNITRKVSEKNLNTLRQFNKIKGTVVSMEEYKFYNTNLIAKCLKTPSTIFKEKEDKRYNESNPTKTVEVQSMPYIK